MAEPAAPAPAAAAPGAPCLPDDDAAAPPAGARPARWPLWRRASLGRRLLMLLLPATLAVSALGLWFTRLESTQAANAAYDRSLAGALNALALNVSTASGGLAVELPYQLFEFFQLTASGAVYFRVATEDGQVEIGHADLPAAPLSLQAGQPRFYDARYFGEPVRVGALLRPLDPPLDGARQVLIQVAESTSSRAGFTQAFLRQALWRDLAWLALLVGAVALASAVALRPLQRLATQTRQRAPEDLRPLDTADLPSDVRPLVEAINQQLGHTAALTEARRRFVDDASHQLRTPLTTLRAQLDYARRETDPLQVGLALQALSTALDQAIRGTNQLLALARSDAAAVQMAPLDLQDLVREVAIALLPEARRRHVDWGLAGDDLPCPARGDRQLLAQALGNLAHNALTHGRPGGCVTLQAGQDTAGWWLTVEDDGPGLPPGVAAALGERFARGPGSPGSGLGLAIARSVMDQHGGQLRVRAADLSGPTGLRATLWWPRPAGAGLADSPRAAPWRQRGDADPPRPATRAEAP